MCIDEGAGELNSLQLADEFEMLGAQFSVSTDSDVILVSLQVLKENFAKAINLFADVLIRPHLNTADFKREQNKVLVNLKQLNVEPDYLADTAFEYFLFGSSSPYSFPTLGIDKTVNKLDIESVRNSYSNSFSPLNSKLVVVGNIDWESLHSEINSILIEWTTKPIMIEQKLEFNKPGKKVFIIEKVGSVHSSLRVLDLQNDALWEVTSKHQWAGARGTRTRAGSNGSRSKPPMLSMARSSTNGQSRADAHPRHHFAYNGLMSIDNIEVESLKLSAWPARARLAERLQESLEHLSPDENQQVWAEEAERRDAARADGTPGRPASDVFPDARARSK